jgi:hypothetical protein
MRRTPCVLLIVTAAVLASCNTFRVAGAATFGRVHEISVADIEAAIAAYKAAHICEDTSVAQIQVISHDEVRLYGDRGPGPYVIMPRVHGKWRYYNTGGIFTS